VGGGGGIRPKGDSRFDALVPWDLNADFIPDDGWATGIFTFSPPRHSVATSYAICHS
jgi:hypothetical protein